MSNHHRHQPVRRFPLSVAGASIEMPVAIAIALIACALPAPASAADDTTLQRLASCQDSWLEWKDIKPRMTQYTDYVDAHLDRDGDGAGFAPKSPASAFGLPVAQVFPASVGTGVGFSLIVKADFAQTRRSFEKLLGKAMTCAVSDGTPACELQIGNRKTAVLMTDDPRSKTTLAGCYYYYQQ